MRLARILTRSEETWGPHTGCLDETALAALVDGDLPRDAREELERHLADCGWCVRRLALLASLADEAATSESPSRTAAGAERHTAVVPRRRLDFFRWAAAAAALALVSGGLGWRLAENRNRPAETAGVRESQRVVDERTGINLLAPVGATLSLDSQRQIQWSTVPGSLFYTVTLAKSDGTPLWESESRFNEIRIPTDVALDASATYYLQVRAHLPDGRTLRSGHVELVLGPR